LVQTLSVALPQISLTLVEDSAAVVAQ